MRNYLFVLLILPMVSFAETSIWQVSKNGSHLFLGGTVHLLKKSDYPLPVEYTSAFKKSDKLYFETDMVKVKSPAFAQKMVKAMMLPNGQTLKSVLKKKTFSSLKTFLAARDIPIDNFMGFKPSMVVLMLSVIEMQRMGMTEVGVDEFFYTKAVKAKKGTGYLETADEQLAFLVSMGQGNEDKMIMSTIVDMKRMGETMNIIKSAWRKGDENKMESVILAEMIRDYPKVYQSLLVTRNNNWMPQIEKMLTDKKIEMVLVGALHLVGKDGLLQQLRRKGYEVKQYK